MKKSIYLKRVLDRLEENTPMYNLYKVLLETQLEIEKQVEFLYNII